MEISSTFQTEAQAKEMLMHLLEKRLIGCGNIQQVTAACWWQGKIQTDAEWILKGKTTQEHAPFALEDIQSHHPYEIPFIAQAQIMVSGEYYEWLVDVLNEDEGEESEEECC
jgi:periplasmic divalent cation tolerance protein